MLKIQTNSFSANQMAVIQAKANEVRKESSLKSGNGVSVTIIFDHAIVKPTKPGSKPPPAKLVGKVTGITNLTKVKSEHYEIIDDRTVAFSCYDNDVMKAAKKLLKDAKTEEEKTKANEAIEAAKAIIGSMTVSEGDNVYIRTFERATVDKLVGLNTVKIVGLEAEGRVYQGKVYTELVSASILPIKSNILEMVNVNQQTVSLPDPNKAGGASFLLLYGDYVRQNASDGHVVQKMMSNSTDEKDYKYGREGESIKLKMNLTMWQKQEPQGDFMLNATILDDDADKKTTLRRSFGINEPDIFGKIMAANPVPCLGLFFVNRDATEPQNMGRDPATDGGTLVLWGNAVRFYLRDYLLQSCPQVSFSFVKEALGVEPDCDDRYATVQLDSPGNICRLNALNLQSQKGKYVLVGDKVACASFFTGNLSHLNNQGCQWRVMHSRVSDPQTRAQESEMSIQEAEKMLVTIPTKVIYAVMPFEKEEEVVVAEEEDIPETKKRVKEESEEVVEQEQEEEEEPKTKKAKAKTTKKKK